MRDSAGVLALISHVELAIPVHYNVSVVLNNVFGPEMALEYL